MAEMLSNKRIHKVTLEDKMNTTLKRVLAILVILLIAFGWYVTLFGLGSVMEPTKDKIKLGLDIKGGVYVVMEAQTD